MSRMLEVRQGALREVAGAHRTGPDALMPDQTRPARPGAAYRHFVDYGDGEGYKRDLPAQCDALSNGKRS